MSSSSGRAQRFVYNVIWTWIGVGANLFTGLIVSPYLVMKLGKEGYGVWALAFTLVDYYYLFDLGIRSATVRYVARYWALNLPVKVNEVISTSIAYASCAGCVGLLLTLGFSHFSHRIFNIPPAYQIQFSQLILIVGVNWCIGIVCGLFGYSLEAIQRFDLSNRVAAVITVLRSAGTFLLLYLGYGLVEIGLLALISQSCGYFINYINFRRIFTTPLSLRHATRPMFTELRHYGVHAFLAQFSTQVLTLSAPVMIGAFRSVQDVGYYSFAVRLLQYTIEMVNRIGTVTSTNTAELQAKGERDKLREMAIYPNRYAVVLFFPLAIFLWTHGLPLFQRWIKEPEFANQSYPVLCVLLAGSLIAPVGQFSSSMILMALAKHQVYARGLVLEAAVGTALLAWAIPRYGVLGAAVVSASLMVVVRGIFTARLVAEAVEMKTSTFLHSVFTWPVLAAAPVFLLSWWLRISVLKGNSWAELFAAGAIDAVIYYGLAYVLCLPDHHRELLHRLIGTLRQKVSGAV